MATAMRATSFTGAPVRLAQTARRPLPVPITVVASQRVIQGRVVSAVCQNTITVVVDTYRVDRIYGKRVRRSKKYHVHDESNAVEVGDTVEIVGCQQMSKTKSHKVDRIVRKVVKL